MKKSSTSVALAVALALGRAVASESVVVADVPPIDIDSRLPVPASSARAIVTDLGRSDGLRSFAVSVQCDCETTQGFVADGRSVTRLRVTLTDDQGQPVKESIKARLTLEGARTRGAELVIRDGVGEFEFVAPTGARDVMWQIDMRGLRQQGRIAFIPERRDLLAIGVVEAVVDFDRRQRGEIGPIAGLSDGLERDLRKWERQFNGGRGSVSGQTQFFVKGSLKNETAVTAMFDSEKDLRQREFRDYNPDRYYPVMGDSAERGYEAKSSERFYLRLDRERDYLLFGDFATGSDSSLSQGGGRLAPLKRVDLGQYNRSMTGLRARKDDGQGYLDAFGMRESLTQVIEEYRGNGTSGPYAVGRYNALENSEKVEVIVRDRNNTSRILSMRSMERYTDYTFEPFSGRILLKSPLASVDQDLNPVSLRITYEVDTGGEKFWVYGLNAERQLSNRVGVGLNWVRDDNPQAPQGFGYSTFPGSGFAEVRELVSGHVSMDGGQLGSLVLEWAQSDSAAANGDLTGSALRFDWQGESEALTQGGLGSSWRVFGGSADNQWVNPASSLDTGRDEIGLQWSSRFNEASRVHVNGSYTEDGLTSGERGGLSVAFERDVNERTILDLAVRHLYQRNGGVASLSLTSGLMVLPGQGPAYGGPGLNPNGAGFWGMGVGLDPITGQPQSAFAGSPVTSAAIGRDLDVTSYIVGVRSRVNEAWSVGAEVGHDQGFEDNPAWFALNSDYRYQAGRAFARIEAPTGRATAGLDYQISSSVALYGRWEETNGLASKYSIDDASQSQAIVFGVRRLDEEGGSVHSELRMRDGLNSQEMEAVSGLSHSFALTDTVDAHFIAERLEILEGSARSATALGGGLEFGDSTWQGTTRLEWRRLDAAQTATVDDTADSMMATVSFSRKMSGEWTGLMRNFALVTDVRDQRGTQTQNRFQLGAAYRPTGSTSFDLLLRYENKAERNSELPVVESRDVHIASTHFNWHPNRRLWLSGRLAVKDLRETLSGVRDDYQAYLVSGRVTHDLSDRFDVGVMAGFMGSPDSKAREEVYGVEVGYRVKDNVWMSAGHNFAGFSDRDLSGREQTERGWYLRLRMKFDEKWLQSWLQ